MMPHPERMIDKVLSEEEEDIIRDEETSPKNTTLYFNILLKAKEIFNVKLDLIKEHYNSAEEKEIL